jgi:hypothetical protein
VPGEGRLAHARADHPPVPEARIGVVLANLGTPDATDYWSMRRYLNQFLSDRRVIDYPRYLWQPLLQGVILSKRPFSSGANYDKIWDRERNESPLLTTTRDQAAAVAAEMAERYGDRVLVDFAMRYGNPSTPSVIARLQAAGCERIASASGSMLPMDVVSRSWIHLTVRTLPTLPVAAARMWIGRLRRLGRRWPATGDACRRPTVVASCIGSARAC